MSAERPSNPGSLEAAAAYFHDQAPDLEYTINSLLRDIYNFQAAGASPMVQRSVLLKDGRMLRLYGSLI